MFSSDIQNDGGIHISLLFALDVCTNMNIYARVYGHINKSIRSKVEIDRTTVLINTCNTKLGKYVICLLLTCFVIYLHVCKYKCLDFF